MNNKELEDYLHEQIPASKALEIGVKYCNETRVELVAPLAVNINHKNTAFGGSLSVIAILAGWSLVFMRLHGIRNEIVIQDSSISYLKAATSDFTAVCQFDPGAQWSRFERSFERHGRARIMVKSHIVCANEVVASHSGVYVAFKK